MTRSEARALLNRNREDFGGRDPGNVMTALRLVFERATPAERAVINEVIREWFLSGSDAERFDAAFLTSEFNIVQNLDLVTRLCDKPPKPGDPVAPFEAKKYQRLAARLLEAPGPDFSIADGVLQEWSTRNGLRVQTRHRDEDVRSIPVVVAAGHEFQIWLEEEFGGYRVHAARSDRRRPQRASWSSEPVLPQGLAATLDAALAKVRQWDAESETPA